MDAKTGPESASASKMHHGDSLMAFSRNQARKGAQSTIRSREESKVDLAKHSAARNNFLADNEGDDDKA